MALTQSPPELVGLALNEEVDPFMLIEQLLAEEVLQLGQCVVGQTRYR